MIIDEINSQFGAVANINCAGFDADINTIPPVVVDFSEPKDLSNCFIFEEITTTPGRYKNESECVDALKSAIGKYINSIIPILSDRRKATIVWRIFPEVKYFDDPGSWAGYARLSVINNNSKRRNFWTKQDV